MSEGRKTGLAIETKGLVKRYNEEVLARLFKGLYRDCSTSMG